MNDVQEIYLKISWSRMMNGYLQWGGIRWEDDIYNGYDSEWWWNIMEHSVDMWLVCISVILYALIDWLIT